MKPKQDFATRIPLRKFRRLLLTWYPEHRRRLPWREQPSLYKTVVSEFMLQQTQVKTALGHFERWLKRFPDFQALAAAPEPDVLKYWEGLGYYNRARNLHRLAKAVAAMKTIPRTPEAWRELPGVGPYTAAAITSIAFGARAACVDGNVIRILTRIQVDGTRYRDSSAAAAAWQPLADRLLDPGNPGDHNQAMMELGATVCLRRRPLCAACPVVSFCLAAARGDPDTYPRFVPKRIEKRDVTRLWCRKGNSLLLHKPDAGARQLADLYELPEPAHLGLPENHPESLGPVLATKVRHITRFRITETIRFYSGEPPQLPRNANGLEWIPLENFQSITLSGPHRRWVTELVQHEDTPDSPAEEHPGYSRA